MCSVIFSDKGGGRERRTEEVLAATSLKGEGD